MSLRRNSGILAAGGLGVCTALAGGSLQEEFAQFRESHRVSHRIVAGNDWSFIDTEKGATTVVILPGGGGDAESMFPVVSALAERFRVIAIGYPATARTLPELVDGLRHILDERGVEHCCVLGHSLGGMVARAYAEADPARVEGLVIANSAIYSPGRAFFLKLLLPATAVLPQPAMRSLIRFEFKRLLRALPAEDGEFWLWYVNQCEMMQPGAVGLRSQMHCLLDVVGHDRGGPAAASWRGRMLILESDEETGFTLGERGRFRGLHPDAIVTTLAHAGHLSFITHRQEFVAAVAEFLTSLPHHPEPRPAFPPPHV